MSEAPLFLHIWKWFGSDNLADTTTNFDRWQSGESGEGGQEHRDELRNISLQIEKHVRQLDNLSPRARMACHYHCQRSFASAVDQVLHPMAGKWQRGNLGFGKVFKTGVGERESNSQSSSRDEDGKQPFHYSAISMYHSACQRTFQSVQEISACMQFGCV